MNPERFLVTAAGGMIGRSLDFGLRLGRAELDITGPAQIARTLDDLKPSGILHLAAADLRSCQRDPVAALKVNVEATRTLVLAARERGLFMVYLSSGTVFRGLRGEGLDENAQPDPLNIYGMTKYLAELTVRDHLPQRSLIVRTGWVFGDHGAHHRKYVDVAIEKALANQSIWANATQDGSWTYVADLVQELRRLIASDVHGVRHVINSGAGTGLNLAQEIRSILGSQAPVVTDQASQGADSAIPRSPFVNGLSGFAPVICSF